MISKFHFWRIFFSVFFASVKRTNAQTGVCVTYSIQNFANPLNSKRQLSELRNSGLVKIL